jgi:hypothetical protein
MLKRLEREQTSLSEERRAYNFTPSQLFVEIRLTTLTIGKTSPSSSSISLY